MSQPQVGAVTFPTYDSEKGTLPVPIPADGLVRAPSGQSIGRAMSRGSLVMTEEGQSVISFQNLYYSVKAKVSKDVTKFSDRFSKTEYYDKQILNNVSGLFKPGRATAVMGASGAGKTSLLQVISGEANSGTVVGKLAINGVSVQPSQLKKISGFVFQDDIILQTMTVNEVLSMCAKLTLPANLTDDERTQRVEETIAMLKLDKARNTIVGDSDERGLSGGERKRLACGMALISNPSCLFLDEPTSGLDTFTASKVVSILRDVARTGRTVVATIHQPSAETFFMFDDLLLLAEGKVVYHGAVKDMLPYFETNFGYKAPTYDNPADWVFSHILNVFRDDAGANAEIDSDSEHAEALTDGPGLAKEMEMKHRNVPTEAPITRTAAARIASLTDTWPNTVEARQIDAQLNMINSGGLKGNMDSIAVNTKRSFWVQWSYLLGRTWRNAFRNKLVFRAKFGQAIFMALFLGLSYLNTNQITDPQVQTQNFIGVIFFLATSTIMSSSMGVLSVFAEEKAVFRREYTNGFYGLAAFFFSKVGIELPMSILFILIQATIIYWMVGLSPWFVNYVVTMVFVALSTACGLSLGLCLASMFDSLQVALVLTPLLLLPLMLFSGLFINTASIGWWFRWISYISPMRYAAEGMIKVNLSEQTANQLFPDGLSVLACAMILLAELVLLICLAYLGLYRVTVLSRKRVVWKSAAPVVPSEKVV